MGPGPVPESLPKHKSGSIVSFIWASRPLENFQITVLSPLKNRRGKRRSVVEADERANSSALARLYSAMDSRHASLGRRTLEDIRQKRAAEKLSKTSSGPDLSKASIPIGSSSIFR
ncbi:unnamed protein product [Prunus armeniaca]|uniref:Uncharacterized protein n=1 Tax=Prunus armeniaca TaxID=36596 RepID=A0A6J5XK17_PRUAR|nr:unnamed protein product [Prunus armeniaca]CAB4312787.1 unnamed protein product [Prunus armeniaca]